MAHRDNAPPHPRSHARHDPSAPGVRRQSLARLRAKIAGAHSVGRSPMPSVSRARRGRQLQLLEPVTACRYTVPPCCLPHRYRALLVREAITALRASLPPAADAPRETRPEREALATALHDFDIGSFVGLSAPFLLPECQPAAWANARCNRPFPEGLLRGDASCRHRATIHIITIYKSWTLRFEESEAAPLRPGESIWSRIYVWELAHLLHEAEGTRHVWHDHDSLFMADDAGTWRTLHPLLSLEACGVFGAAVTLHLTRETREWPGWNLGTPGISDADAYGGLSRIGGHCSSTFGLSQRRYHPDL